MAIIFNDTFTDTGGTALTAHTPDTGTGWTEEESSTASAVAQVGSGGTNCDTSASEVNTLLLLSAQPNPTPAEYDIIIDVTTFGGSENRDSFHLIARYQDSSNYYGVRIEGDGVGGILYKYVSGSRTDLDNNTSGPPTWVNGDTIKFEIRDATKKIYQNDSEVMTTTDNAITGAGKVGIAWGGVAGLTLDDVRSDWVLDNFQVDDLTSAGSEGPLVGGRLVAGGSLIKGVLIG